MVEIGIVQVAPVHLDLKNSLKKLFIWIDKGGEKRLDLLVLGETWLSGYPAWLDYCEGVALWDDPSMKKAYRKMHESSITVPGPQTKQISIRAKKYEMIICLGVNERVDSGKGNGTIYNSLLIFNEKGELAVHRRKLMPTFSEKLVYGLGDGKDLKSIDTKFGRVGGLICWEHWMPLARQAMHNSGEHIHVGLWPSLYEKQRLACKHYAFEGRCFVLAAGQLMHSNDIPEGLKKPEISGNLLNGGSCVIDPRGDYVVEPVFEKETLITASIDIGQAVEERMSLDTSGHYQRDDVFTFEVNRDRRS